MKRVYLLIVFVSFSQMLFSQTKDIENLLKSIEGQWKLDESGYLTYQSVIDIPGIKKDDLFLRATNFFIYNFKFPDEIIQLKDKEQGCVIGKAHWLSLYNGTASLVVGVNYDAFFVVRIDVKDEKARITLTVQDYNINMAGVDYPKIPIKSMYPINKDSKNKKQDREAFYKMHQLSSSILETSSKSLKEGAVPENEQKTW